MNQRSVRWRCNHACMQSEATGGCRRGASDLRTTAPDVTRHGVRENDGMTYILADFEHVRGGILGHSAVSQGPSGIGDLLPSHSSPDHHCIDDPTQCTILRWRRVQRTGRDDELGWPEGEAKSRESGKEAGRMATKTFGKCCSISLHSA